MSCQISARLKFWIICLIGIIVLQLKFISININTSWTEPSSIGSIFWPLLCVMAFMSHVMLSHKPRQEWKMEIFSFITFFVFYFVADIILTTPIQQLTDYLIGSNIQRQPIFLFPYMLNLLCLSMVGLSGIVYIFNTKKMKLRLSKIGKLIWGIIGTYGCTKLLPTNWHQEIGHKELVLYGLFGGLLIFCNRYMTSPTHKYSHE